MPKQFRISKSRIEKDWQILAGDIGERRAGTRSEQMAADFIQKRFRNASCIAHQEAFPCPSLRSARVSVQIKEGKRWKRVESRVLVGAPSTRGPVEGKLVWLEMPEEAPRLKKGSLKGKILALFGPLPTNVAHHKALIAADPLAVIHVDERLPFVWAKNDGVYPLWTKKYGVSTTVTVPYMEAWRWRCEGLDRVRVDVKVNVVEAKSQNVVADLPGSDPSLPAIVLSAHHDTQCNLDGADDNGSGVMCLLELARVLSKAKRKRTLRFISFGTEEQLSVGSAAYVTAHRKEMKNIGLVVNFDSVASPIGHTYLYTAGSDALIDHTIRALNRGDLLVQHKDEVVPFSDHFPFNAYGVPSIWFHRGNFTGGKWNHHSKFDDLANASADPLVKIMNATAPLVQSLGNSTKWPFTRGLPPAQKKLTQEWAKTLYGLKV